MRIQTLVHLRKALQSQPVLIGIASKEPLESESAVALLLKKESVVTLMADAPIRQIMGELQPSLLTQRPVLVIQKAHTLSKPSQKELALYCENPSTSSCLVLVGDTIPSVLSKAIENKGVLLSFPVPKPWEKEEALAAQLSIKQISLALSKEIVQRSGGDGVIAAKEIEKLLTYVGDRQVTLSDIEAIVISDKTENVWQLGDAIMQCQAAKALNIIHTLLESGEAFISILALLRSQMRDACLAATLSQDALAKALPKLRPRRLEQLSSLAKSWGEGRCQQALLLIYQADLDARSSIANSNLLADRLIARLVQ